MLAVTYITLDELRNILKDQEANLIKWKSEGLYLTSMACQTYIDSLKTRIAKAETIRQNKA